MGTKYKATYCVYCQKRVRAEKRTPSGIFHFIFSVLTCGIWLFVWMMDSFGSALRGYQCPVCGGKKFADRT